MFVFREALGGLKRDDGTVHAEDVLRMLEEVSQPQTNNIAARLDCCDH